MSGVRVQGFLGVGVSVIVLQPKQMDWLTKHILAGDVDMVFEGRFRCWGLEIDVVK